MESLCHTPETSVMWYVNYTPIKKEKEQGTKEGGNITTDPRNVKRIQGILGTNPEC